MEIAEQGSSTVSVAKQILKRFFGFNQFRGIQESIIQDLLQGQDLLVLMPTGGGKSLCYQVPALIREGVAIVVSPLIALMEDQVAALKLQGIKAAYYNSSLTGAESRKVLAQLHAKDLDLLYIAPERLISTSFLERLKECTIGLFAIDEAHCISQWGHDFRPEYAELGQLKVHFPKTPLIALTATADKQTRSDIINKLCYQPKLYIASFNRANIHYSVLLKNNPFKQLNQFLATQQEKAGIIYCGTRNTVDTLTLKLQENGFKAEAYHAGLTYTARREVQSLFRHDHINIIVATLAFGMGIDKPNVRFIVHYDLPKTIEHYYQETGRAGRDGLPAQALLLYDPADSARLKSWIMAMEDSNQQRVENNKLNHMIAFAQANHCRRQILLHYFDEEGATICNYCDICDSPPPTQNVTQDAQKFLSCIYRLNQNFGMIYIIDILKGSTVEKIKKAGHHTLTTYGLGKHQSTDYWKQLAWHLIHQDYCYQDMHHYNVLRLTNKAKALLKGEQQVMLSFKDTKLPKVAKIRETTKPLFDALKVLRKEIAEQEKKPVFLIFSDNSLLDMVEKKPTTLDAFLEITGVGQHKCDHYGLRFLKVIRQFEE